MERFHHECEEADAAAAAAETGQGHRPLLVHPPDQCLDPRRRPWTSTMTTPTSFRPSTQAGIPWTRAGETAYQAAARMAAGIHPT